jgi:hypothetical protein
LDQVRAFVPAIRTYRDARELLDDKSIDAVLIAIPQHLHAQHFEKAMHSCKDDFPGIPVYNGVGFVTTHQPFRESGAESRAVRRFLSNHSSQTLSAVDGSPQLRTDETAHSAALSVSGSFDSL